MRPKKHTDTKNTDKKKKMDSSSGCSSRLESLSVHQRTKTKVSQMEVTKEKAQKGLQHASETITKREKGSHVTKLSKEKEHGKQLFQAPESKCVSKEHSSKQLANTTTKRETTKDHVPGIKIPGALKRKPKRLHVEHSNKVRKTVQNDPGSSRMTNQRGKLQLIKEITIKENHYGKPSITRYSDVAFLDDNHVLALDDNFLRRKHGQRICCLSLDGTLVCELLVPGYPWSVVVLSPNEAVVSMRGLGSNRLLWISIDIHKKSMEITRNIPFEVEPFGLSYSDSLETFIVSYNKEPYMSVLNREGEEIRKMSCKPGPHYRCLILEDKTILFLDHHNNMVCIMDQRGEVMKHLRHHNLKEPQTLESDCFGNIYVGCFKSGHLLKFDSKGRYLRTFECFPSLSAIGLDRTSDRIAFATNNSIFIYTFDKNVDTSKYC